MNTVLKLWFDDEVMDAVHGLIHRLRFDTDTNRSVQGSMNQMIQELKWHLHGVEVRDLLGYRQNVYFSERPCRVKGRKEAVFPQRDFLDLIKHS